MEKDAEQEAHLPATNGKILELMKKQSDPFLKKAIVFLYYLYLYRYLKAKIKYFLNN